MEDTLLIESVRQFIREKWEELTDEELSSQINEQPGLDWSARDVGKIRRSLSLKRKRGRTKGSGTIAKLDLKDLKEALTKKGLTYGEYITTRNLTISESSLRSICNLSEIDVREDRSPEWYANRIGRPELGREDWFGAMYQECDTFNFMATRLGVDSWWLQHQAQRLEIDTVRAPEILSFVCDYCGKRFQRSAQNSNLGQNLEHAFCNQVCCGEWRKGRKRGPNRKEVVANESD